MVETIDGIVPRVFYHVTPRVAVFFPLAAPRRKTLQLLLIVSDHTGCAVTSGGSTGNNRHLAALIEHIIGRVISVIDMFGWHSGSWFLDWTAFVCFRHFALTNSLNRRILLNPWYLSITNTGKFCVRGIVSVLLLRQSCSDRLIFYLIIGVGEKNKDAWRSSSGTSPRPWTPGGMSPQCVSSFHYISLASALGGDTISHLPPSNLTGAPAGRTAASFASRPNACQPPRVNIVRPAR